MRNEVKSRRMTGSKKQIMRWSLTILLLGIIFIGLGAKCPWQKDSDHDSGSSGTSTSPFAGHWIGTWWDDIHSDDGTLDIVIGPDGNFSGSIHNISRQLDGTASGTIANNGALNCAFAYPGDTLITGSGTVVINENGHLVGIIQNYYEGAPAGSLDIDLTKQ